MKIDTTKWLTVAVLIFTTIFIWELLIRPKLFPSRTETIEVNTTEWEAVRHWQDIAEQSTLIARYAQNFRPRLIVVHEDSIIIDSTTQVKDIPIQLFSECYDVPLLVNKDTSNIQIYVDAQYQLIDWIKVYTKPLPYPIKVEVKTPNKIDFWMQGAVSYTTQRRIQVETGMGVSIGKHLFLYGGAEVNDQLDAIGKAGIGWRL